MTALADDWTMGENRLRGQRCAEGHRWYLPRLRCPHCGAEASSFEPSGGGTVFAQTSVHRHTGAQTEPIGIALVDLDDGIRVMARCPPGTPIDSRVFVSITFDRDSQQLLPMCEVIAQ